MSDGCRTFRNLAFAENDPTSHTGIEPTGALRRSPGFGFGMAAIEVGIRELQRRMADRLARVEEERCGVIVSRHGQPVAVLLPISQARVWVLMNRRLVGEELLEDESFWPIEEGVRVGPAATEPLAALPEQARRQLMTRLRKLRGLDGTGRNAIRAGPWWALVDLSGGLDPPTLLRIARRAELERWLTAPDLGA